MNPGLKPNIEAESVEIRADHISDPMYFPRSNTHGANRIVAKGNIVVTIRKQHPGSRDQDIRPIVGTILHGAGEDAEITVEARRIGKIRRVHTHDSATASMRVEIFGELELKML